MLEFDLYTYLSTKEEIIELCENRVYPQNIPQDNYPLKATTLVITLVSAEHESALGGPTGTAYNTYQIDCWSLLLNECVNLSEIVRMSLQGYAGAMGSSTINFVELEQEETNHHAPEDASDNWSYCRMQVYRIRYKEAV